jgi:hypothetical protein
MATAKAIRRAKAPSIYPRDTVGFRRKPPDPRLRPRAGEGFVVESEDQRREADQASCFAHACLAIALDEGIRYLGPTDTERAAADPPS